MPDKKAPDQSQPEAQPSAGDQGQAEVQANMDEATERGYIGAVPDPTPNEAYTVQGAASGAPTPETDKAARAAAEKSAADLAAKQEVGQ